MHGRATLPSPGRAGDVAGSRRRYNATVMKSAARRAPAVLKALGRSCFPQTLDLPEGRYELVHVFKHDFFAATGLLRRRDGHQVVLKINRMADLLGLPGRWIGRFLARREALIYQALADLEPVPRFMGLWGDCGFVHEYVVGHPMRADEAVGDEFFGALEQIIDRMHARGMAYVDLEKCENIIVDHNGRPSLIDFQISWHLPGRLGRLPPLCWIRDLLQDMDSYHLLKHRRRTRPDQLSAEQLDESYKLPGYLKVHRAVVKPLQRLRRGALRRLDPQYPSASR